MKRFIIKSSSRDNYKINGNTRTSRAQRTHAHSELGLETNHPFLPQSAISARRRSQASASASDHEQLRSFQTCLDCYSQLHHYGREVVPALRLALQSQQIWSRRTAYPLWGVSAPAFGVKSPRIRSASTAQKSSQVGYLFSQDHHRSS